LERARINWKDTCGEGELEWYLPMMTSVPENYRERLCNAVWYTFGEIKQEE
jgi:hypothetical protein